MALKNRFIIRRKDTDTGIDDVVLESEGLTIGRLIGNDLVLNHRAVSRTHVGIKAIAGDYWLFNLSASNGTLLNGELVDRTPLADGDVVQIGPYLLQVNYIQQALSITVKRKLEVQPLDPRPAAALAPEGGGGSDATLLVKIITLQEQQTLIAGGSRRLQGTGMLTGLLPAIDEQALNIFWDKRKREAGKIEARTLLHPRGLQKVGKAQFNWRPTLDLRQLWRKSYFAWSVVVVASLATAALFVYEGAYSPGDISGPHASQQMSARGIALRPNQSSCSDCHGLQGTLQDNCASCHTTQSFQPAVYDAHKRESIGCSSCHTEHQGSSPEAGLVSYGLCANCHNDSYEIKAGERAGSRLGTPHGGKVGYPVKAGKWEWGLSADHLRRKGLPERWAEFAPKDQFHAIHQKGRMADKKGNPKIKCAECHSGTRGSEHFRQSPRAECAKCHGTSYTTAEGVQLQQAKCNTCHQQHGESEDFAKTVFAAGTDDKRLKDYLASLNTGGREDQGAGPAPLPLFPIVGGADVMRQNKDAFVSGFPSNFGALPWYWWAALVAAVPIAGLAVMAFGTARRKYSLKTLAVEAKTPGEGEKLGSRSLDLEKLQAEGPAYPHPVIDPLLCIGCHACVEACPHDVLTIVNGIATPAALDQCMEDTSCQVECPTSPKACVVVNTNKVIPPRKVPARNQRLMTNVDGVYMIGDVSGVPLIKNAVNEGGQVIDCVIDDIRREGPNGGAEYDVAIIGVGPAGLSAAVIAQQRGLSYIAIEQDKMVSTIQNYPAGKYVFYKPDTVEAKGGVPLPGPGGKKEEMLETWMIVMMSNGVEINEEESCTGLKREDGFFTVATEKGKLKVKSAYRARKIILAIGNRGTPMKLRVPGEELKMLVQPEPVPAKHCPKCGAARRNGQLFCVNCGAQLPLKPLPPYEDSKVKYKLSDPDDYVNKRCIVVGAGNSAIEAAVDLTGFKREGDRITFTRNNEVTLVVRSDFKGDLKLGNKINVYDCIDAGKIKVFFRAEIKEIKGAEVALMDTRSKEEKARMPNDYIFAMIGGERPTKFLEGIGIKIG